MQRCTALGSPRQRKKKISKDDDDADFDDAADDKQFVYFGHDEVLDDYFHDNGVVFSILQNVTGFVH